MLENSSCEVGAEHLRTAEVDVIGVRDGVPVDVIKGVRQVCPKEMEGGPLAVGSDRQHRHRSRHIGFTHHQGGVDADAAQQ
jgi:hypothetical protein